MVGPFATDNTGRPADHRAERGWPTRRDHQNEPLPCISWGSFWWSRLVGAWPRRATRQRDGARTGSVLSVSSVARLGTDTTRKRPRSGRRRSRATIADGCPPTIFATSL